MGFPDDDMYGVDVVIPDVTYLMKNKNRIRGVFLTHGHEDHIGALPYVMRPAQRAHLRHPPDRGAREAQAGRSTACSTRRKIITVEAGETIPAGCFEVEFIHVNHSIADAVALAHQDAGGHRDPHRRLQDRRHAHPGRA